MKEVNNKIGHQKLNWSRKSLLCPPNEVWRVGTYSVYSIFSTNILSTFCLKNYLINLYETSHTQSVGWVDVSLALLMLIIHMIGKIWIYQFRFVWKTHLKQHSISGLTCWFSNFRVPSYFIYPGWWTENIRRLKYITYVDLYLWWNLDHCNGELLIHMLSLIGKV